MIKTKVTKNHATKTHPEIVNLVNRAQVVTNVSHSIMSQDS
jgi:hypothetical protein